MIFNNYGIDGLGVVKCYTTIVREARLATNVCQDIQVWCDKKCSKQFAKQLEFTCCHSFNHQIQHILFSLIILWPLLSQIYNSPLTMMNCPKACPQLFTGHLPQLVYRSYTIAYPQATFLSLSTSTYQGLHDTTVYCCTNQCSLQYENTRKVCNCLTISFTS